MEAIPYIVMALSTGAAVYSASEQSRAQKGQYEAQAAANAYNAAALKERADQVAKATNQREEAMRVQNRLQRGKRLAFVAQSGTGFEGSNLDVERQNDMLSELDALNVRYQGHLEANGLLSQAGLEEQYQGMNMNSASTAQRMGYISMAGAALSGADKGYNYKSPYGTGGISVANDYHG